MKQRSKIMALGLFISCALLWTAAPAAAQSTCAQQGTISINSNQYIYQQNEWNSTAPQCATVSGVGFSLTTANFNLPNGGAPATYPSIFMGCHWGNCTNASQSHMPIQESNIASASTSVNAALTSGGNYDVAYDIWFNQTSTTSGQPNGTEVMVWINHNGFPQPFGSQVATVTIDGASWAVWTGRQSSWNIVSYVRNPGVTSVSNLNLLPFFSDAVSRGSLETSWWLIDVEMGFEVWTGGQGLGISNFAVSATAGSGGGGGGGSTTPSIASISPASGTAGSSVTLTGTNFGSTQGSSTVNFGVTPATVTSWSNTSITATVPNLTAGAVSVSVTVGGTTSNSVSYTVNASGGGGGGGSSSCHITYTITNSWSGGFQAAITIGNTGSTALSNWSLKWTYGGNQQITSLWNGSLTQSGESETVNSLSYNGSIPAGGSYNGMGFTGTVTGTNAVPTSFTLNGTTCN
jgi:Cellulose binding domain/Glycosyl hydrolase family 12/IPT/TIG domain